MTGGPNSNTNSPHPGICLMVVKDAEARPASTSLTIIMLPLTSSAGAQLLRRVRLCNPVECGPPGSCVCGISPGKNTGVEVFWTLWEKARVGWFETIALKHVYYHLWKRSPVQVRCMRQGAQGWCTGMTQRDGVGREVRGRVRMENTWTPMADSWRCMAKTTRIL